MTVLQKDSKEEFTGVRFIPGIEDDQMHMEHYQRYRSITSLVENKIVVDAACGEGYGTSIIANKALKVIGIDIDTKSIERAKEKYTAANIKFINGNVAILPLENESIDVFVSFETIEHISEELQFKFLEEIARVLKKDGILIMSTPNKEIYSDLFNYNNEFHIKEFYKEEFVQFIQSKFKFMKLYHQFFEILGVIALQENIENNALFINEQGKYNIDGKYLIAIASNEELPAINITSFYMNTKKEYIEKNQRILQLQNEVEERNVHLKELDYEIEYNRNNIKNLQNEVEVKNKRIQLLNSNLDNLNLKYEVVALEQDKLTHERDKQIHKLEMELERVVNINNALINEKNVIINSKVEEINQLNRLINDRDYVINQKDTIILDLMHRSIRIPSYIYKTSRRLKKIPRRIYERLFPLNTKRRTFISRSKNYVIHPLQTARVKRMYKIEKVTKNVKFEELKFPLYEEPLVSIIIPVYNQINYTYNCLKSILQETSNIKYEIIIADDVSSDKTKEILEFVHGITVVRNDKNLGFLRNCNHAASVAKGQYIFFLNNDTKVLSNWLEPLVELMEKDQTIGMTGSKLIFSNGTLQEAGGIVWSDASAWNFGRGDDPTKSEYNYVKEVDYISGAAIMIRKKLWEDIGGFDERYVPAYCEDSDLAFEVRKRGYKVVYQPLSQIVHFEGVSNGVDTNSGIKRYQVENNEKFRLKWQDELSKHYPNAVDVFRARERAFHKKIILVIDHYVPTFDKDAGSKTTFQYLKMFLKKGYCVKFIGDNFYQSEPYTTILQQMGIEVLYGPWYANHILSWIKTNKDYIHIAYLNRPHITEKYVDFLKNETNIKLIYYGHDLHSLRLQREYELTGNPNKLKESKEWLEKEISIMQKVNMSYYPSIIEEEEIHKIAPNIPVKAITAYVYDTFKENILSDFSNRDGILFVGGFGHAPNVDAVLWFVNSIYPIIREKLTTTFYIVGSNPTADIKNIKQEGVVVKGFVSEDELEELYSKCKVVVVPLRYGAGVKGKVIEAFYNGIPVITTSCGAEGIPEGDGVFAIADSEQDFADKVVSLYGDNEKLELYSRNTQRFIKQYYQTDEVWKKIEKDFE